MPPPRPPPRPPPGRRSCTFDHPQVGRGRDAPLAAASLQRTVLLAHLFGSCCRARREAARLRVAAFELARHSAAAEPALLAALCCAWPEALHLDAPPAELPSGGAAAFGLGQVLGALACRNVGRPLDDGGATAGAAAACGLFCSESVVCERLYSQRRSGSPQMLFCDNVLALETRD